MRQLLSVSLSQSMQSVRWRERDSALILPRALRADVLPRAAMTLQSVYNKTSVPISPVSLEA